MAGDGRIVATLLPYSVGFFCVWTLRLNLWILLGLPLGPGARMYLAV